VALTDHPVARVSPNKAPARPTWSWSAANCYLREFRAFLRWLAAGSEGELIAQCAQARSAARQLALIPSHFTAVTTPRSLTAADKRLASTDKQFANASSTVRARPPGAAS
jgi:hypothetical protein